CRRLPRHWRRRRGWCPPQHLAPWRVPRWPPSLCRASLLLLRLTWLRRLFPAEHGLGADYVVIRDSDLAFFGLDDETRLVGVGERPPISRLHVGVSRLDHDLAPHRLAIVGRAA